MRIVWLILILFLAACGPAATPTPTVVPTNLPPTPTLAPTPILYTFTGSGAGESESLNLPKGIYHVQVDSGEQMVLSLEPSEGQCGGNEKGSFLFLTAEKGDDTFFNSEGCQAKIVVNTAEGEWQITLSG